MMFRKFLFRALGLLILLSTASCKVEFSPNGTWTEIPLVYCVLDQDADSTFVRVQKCYLGEGNQYDYASISDSINYPQGSLTVQLLKWKSVRGKYSMLTIDPSAIAPQQVIQCDYILHRDKVDGQFYGPEQPLYACRTKGLLDTASVYQLLVISNITGDTIAKASTYLLGDCQNPANMLIKPSVHSRFQFTGTGSNKACEMQWYSLPRARQYQLEVYFYYHEFYRSFNGAAYDTVITPHEIRISCPTVKSNLIASQQNCRLARQTFLSVVRDSVLACNFNLHQGEADVDYSLIPEDTVAVVINACSEDLAAYLFLHQLSDGINQEQHQYSNIEGGLGVFASRRTHLRFVVPTNNSSSGQYNRDLKDLGVGFFQGK